MYVLRNYGKRQADGALKRWLEFHPPNEQTPTLPTERETRFFHSAPEARPKNVSTIGSAGAGWKPAPQT